VVLFFAAWAVCSYVEVERDGVMGPLVREAFLPAPHKVAKTLVFLFFDKDVQMGSAVVVSALRILKAFVLSVGVALPLGILMGSFEAVNRFFNPIVAPLRYLPITAFVPLMILWFGIDEANKVAFLFLGTVVFLLPVVVDAIRSVPDELVQTAFTLGATKRQVVTTVLIPAALPQIFDSFRVMNAIAWTYIVLAELVNSSDGIGYIMSEAAKRNKPDWSIASILVVGVIGLVTDLVIRFANSALFGWREADA
jgi:NitT/TauT family transport system permease protein